MSDKKPVILRKSRLTGFHIIFVGHGQNMPKVPQNCILTTPCLKNSASILYLYIVCDTLKMKIGVFLLIKITRDRFFYFQPNDPKFY